MTVLFIPEIKRQTAVGTPWVEDARPRSARRIEYLLAKVIAGEFIVVAGTAFLCSFIYFNAVLDEWPPMAEYAGAAVIITLLVLLPALGFKQYAAIHAQPRDHFMCSGLGAVTLAFSLFVSILFVFKIGGSYSRGTLFAQFISVGIVMLIARGAIHAHIRRAVKSGHIEARRAVLVGDARANANILGRTRTIRYTLGGISVVARRRGLCGSRH